MQFTVLLGLDSVYLYKFLNENRFHRKKAFFISIHYMHRMIEEDLSSWLLNVQFCI